MSETLRKYGAKYNTTFCSLCGLSTDTKPTGDFDGVGIANGSEFIEMDTGKKFKYDAESSVWNEVSSGGGGSTTLIQKSITANGEYNASDDSADGYSKVTVDVANSYTQADEGKVVSNGALVAQTAYPIEITENGTYDITNYNSITINVSSSPSVNIVTREVDFVNNTKSLTGDISTHPVYTGMGRCNVADDGTINAYYGDTGYTEDGSNGQVMVKVPKFYYKLDVSETGDLDGVNIRHGKWSISNLPVDGFKLHPAFLAADGVTELDYFMYGAFDAVGQDSNGTYSTSYNTTTYKLGSVGGNTYAPTNTLKRATARTMATNRGTGWYSVGVKQTMAVQMLMAVEYGFNSQIGIGQGVVSASSASYAGQTVGNVTSGTQDNKTTPVNWRGIENFWGNIFDWIDGLNIYDRVPYFCNSYTFVDGTTLGYTRIGFNLPSSDNFISALGYDSNNDWIMLPSEASGASATSAIGDYCYSYSGWRVSSLGGLWLNDSRAGAFYWNCYNGSSEAYADNGARLMYIPQTT